METNRTETKQRVYITAIIALLLLNVATLYLVFHEKGNTQTVTQQKTALQEDFRMLNDSLNVRNTEVEQFAGRNAELDKTLAARQQELEEQKAKIQTMMKKDNLTQAELRKLKKMVDEYKASIAEMGDKIATLTKQNEELTAQNTQLSSDLTTERSNVTALTTTNQALGKKVELGSLLPVAKVEVAAIKTRGNGKEVEVMRAKAASNLKISFETGQNRVIEPGAVDVYVRIINPKGETIAVEDQGSGTITAANTNEPVLYTKKANFEYDQQNKKVVVYWGKNIQEPGTYKVELYQGGYVIGQGQVKLS